MQIRPEQPSHCAAIRKVIAAAFATHPHSNHKEQDIVDALRSAHALTVSLVAIKDEQVIGHIACSQVAINGQFDEWYGLGPVAVAPNHQNKGTGAALIRASIELLTARSANGIVLLGEPAYYERFGFSAAHSLSLPGAPASHFLCLPLRKGVADGVVTYHAAFSV